MLFRVGLENCPINRVQWAMLAGGLFPYAGLVLLDRDLQIKAEGIGKWRWQVTVGSRRTWIFPAALDRHSEQFAEDAACHAFAYGHVVPPLVLTRPKVMQRHRVG